MPGLGPRGFGRASTENLCSISPGLSCSQSIPEASRGSPRHPFPQAVTAPGSGHGEAGGRAVISHWGLTAQRVLSCTTHTAGRKAPAFPPPPAPGEPHSGSTACGGAARAGPGAGCARGGAGCSPGSWWGQPQCPELQPRTRGCTRSPSAVGSAALRGVPAPEVRGRAAGVTGGDGAVVVLRLRPSAALRRGHCAPRQRLLPPAPPVSRGAFPPCSLSCCVVTVSRLP